MTFAMKLLDLKIVSTKRHMHALLAEDLFCKSLDTLASFNDHGDWVKGANVAVLCLDMMRR